MSYRESQQGKYREETKQGPQEITLAYLKYSCNCDYVNPDTITSPRPPSLAFFIIFEIALQFPQRTCLIAAVGCIRRISRIQPGF